MRRAALAAALAVAVLAAGPAVAPAAEPRASLPDIEDEVMCTICGTLLETSQSPQAERQRELILGLIDQGLTKDEIKDALVVEYGEEVLAVPDTGGFDLVAWLVPWLALAAALAALGLGARRVLRRRTAEAEGPTAALSDDEAARLEADLSRYEL